MESSRECHSHFAHGATIHHVRGAIRSISSIRRIRTPLRLSGLPGTASMVDDTGLLQPETQRVAGVDPRAQDALHAVHGRFARRRTHEGLAKAARAAR